MLAESSKEIHATVPIDRFVPKGDKLKMGIRIAKLAIQMLSDTFAQARLALVPILHLGCGHRHAIALFT